ncbi:MAG TPA: hypothetical protein VH353_04305 [Caulobacteraceae bacterium]|jgi:hypothetical protein|nr:hypothetical protein [Caulobacteraceae bacterium]
MQRYRVYLSDQPSAVTDLEEVWCAADDEAISAMLDLAGRNAAELWRGADRVYATPRASSFCVVLDEDVASAVSISGRFGFRQSPDLRAL